MKVHHGLESWSPGPEIQIAATLGNFDGVHLGHQIILSRVKSRALDENLTAVILTFDPVPKKVLSPETAPPLIQTLDQRLRRLELSGMDHAVIIPFSREFAAQDAAEFVRKWLVERLHLRFFAVGDKFTFGRQRQGNLDLLRTMGRELGFETNGIPEVQLKGSRISSTLIREKVREGAVDEALQFLGHPFALTGTVVEGAKLGSTIGIPTANLNAMNELIPANGVYVCTAELASGRVPAVANVGYRPTVGGTKLTVEAHLLDFIGNLYGSRMELHFLRRIRSEVRFSSVDELKAQILRDITSARTFFSTND